MFSSIYAALCAYMLVFAVSNQPVQQRMFTSNGAALFAYLLVSAFNGADALQLQRLRLRPATKTLHALALGRPLEPLDTGKQSWNNDEDDEAAHVVDIRTPQSARACLHAAENTVDLTTPQSAAASH